MSKNLYHVTSEESQESILKKGLLSPIEILGLIDEGKLLQTVLGVSSNKNPSHFPRHVSLLEDPEMIKETAKQICYSRTGFPTHPDFTAVVYIISQEIRKHPGFIDSRTVRRINSEAFNSEALYPGRIPTKFIERKGIEVIIY